MNRVSGKAVNCEWEYVWGLKFKYGVQIFMENKV